MYSKIEPYYPGLFICQSKKNTMSVMKLELHPANLSADGFILLRMPTVKQDGSILRLPEWENAIEARLGFLELSKMMQVFRGECESLGDGKGVIIGEDNPVLLRLEHRIESTCGYKLSLKRCVLHAEEYSIMLTNAEALGILCAIEQSLGMVCFGVPAVVERGGEV